MRDHINILVKNFNLYLVFKYPIMYIMMFGLEE